MKIATWNVNSVRSRQQHLLDWLTHHPFEIRPNGEDVINLIAFLPQR
ncbi:MAG: hypothetical protein ACKN9E_19455 [Microcystaceae cyanobacterium]